MNEMLKKVCVVLLALCIAPSITMADAMADDSVVTIIDAMDAAAATILSNEMISTTTPVAQLSSDEVTVENTMTDVVTDEAQHATCRVTFYDFTGNVVATVDVPMGASIEAIDMVPVMSGFMFQHWYDEMDENKDAYAFENGVQGDINLYPYGAASTAEDILALGILGGETAVVETMDVAAQIIADVTPVVCTETPAIEGAGQILAAAAGSAQPTEATPALTVDQILGASIDDVMAQATETEDKNAAQDSDILTVDQILGAAGIAPAAVIEEAAAPEAAQPNEILTMDQLIERNVETPEKADEAMTVIEETAVPLAGPAPSIEVLCEYEGELVKGAEVTVRAVIHNLPGDYQVTYQWQNDASGTYQDVAGATGETYTFHVGDFDEDGCNWRVNVDVFN